MCSRKMFSSMQSVQKKMKFEKAVRPIYQPHAPNDGNIIVIHTVYKIRLRMAICWSLQQGLAHKVVKAILS